jgi:CRISPR type I-E-associated protein CasB/Cse2
VANEDKPVVSAVLTWRGRLLLDIGASRAASARLRRCSTTLDVLMERETIELIKAVRIAGGRDAGVDERVAIIAVALAHAPASGPVRFAEALGRTGEGKSPGPDERPCFSPARFATLLRAAEERDWDALIRALRRAFAILGGTPFNIPAFVEDLVFLNDRRLRRWTYDYWQTSAPPDLTLASGELLPNEAESLP